MNARVEVSLRSHRDREQGIRVPEVEVRQNGDGGPFRPTHYHLPQNTDIFGFVVRGPAQQEPGDVLEHTEPLEVGELGVDRFGARGFL